MWKWIQKWVYSLHRRKITSTIHRALQDTEYATDFSHTLGLQWSMMPWMRLGDVLDVNMKRVLSMLLAPEHGVDRMVLYAKFAENWDALQHKVESGSCDLNETYYLEKTTGALVAVQDPVFKMPPITYTKEWKQRS